MATATAETVSLDKMTPEAKRGLLVAVVQDLMPGGGVMSFQDGGRSYYVFTPLANARELAEQDIRNATPEGLRAVAEALSALRASMAAGEVAAPADYAFHRAVAAASGNELFVAMLEALAGPIRGTMTVALGLTRAGSRERARRVVEEHEAILEAIEAGDPEAASLAMAHHLHRARRRVTDGQRDA